MPLIRKEPGLSKQNTRNFTPTPEEQRLIAIACTDHIELLGIPSTAKANAILKLNQRGILYGINGWRKVTPPEKERNTTK